MPRNTQSPWLLRAAAAAPPIGVELQVGRQEWVHTGPTRELAVVLPAPGRRVVDLVEYQGGHDFAWWRGSLADALIRWADLATIDRACEPCRTGHISLPSGPRVPR